MTDGGSNVLIEIYFSLLMVFSLLLPAAIYSYLMWKKAISRKAVLLLGIILIVISGADLFLLEHLIEMAKVTPTLLNGMLLKHESSVALYLLPLIFAGVGVNIISHILIAHLVDAEKRFDREHQ